MSARYIPCPRARGSARQTGRLGRTEEEGKQEDVDVAEDKESEVVRSCQMGHAQKAIRV